MLPQERRSKRAPRETFAANPRIETSRRLPTETKVTLWPVPDNTTTYTISYFRLKGIDGLSSGVGSTVTSVPPRFVPCLVAGMAYYLAMKKNPQMAASLKQEYEFQFQLAAGEDEETASIRFVPFNTFMMGAG